MSVEPPSLNSGLVAKTVADSLDAAGLSGEAMIVPAGMPVTEIIHHLRAARDGADVLVLVVSADVAEPGRAMIVAAVAPLASEFAPATRLSLIDVRTGGDDAGIVAAACFLVEARSTTGQVLRVGG